MADESSKIESLEDQQKEKEPVPQADSEQPEEEGDEWKTEAFRAKVAERIQEEIMKTGSQVPKSGKYFEDYAFSKASSKKGYLRLIANVLTYVSEFNKKRAKAEEEAEAAKKQEEGESESVAAES